MKIYFLFTLFILPFTSQTKETDTDDLLLQLIKSNFGVFQATKMSIRLGRKGSFRFSFDETHFLVPLCNNEDVRDGNITFHDCILTGIATFNILNQEQLALTVPVTIFDIIVPKIVIYPENGHYLADVDRNAKIIMNTKKPYLEAGVFSFILNLIPGFVEPVLNEYSEGLNAFYTPNEINKKDELNAILSLLFMKEPYFGNYSVPEDNVTYYNLLNVKFDSMVNMRDRVRVGKLSILAEFSIDYDLNYKEGELVFHNLAFSREREGRDVIEFVVNGNETISQKTKKFLTDSIMRRFGEAINEYYSKTNS